MRKTKIIVSGGGTGGHIFPAISIANELKRKIQNLEILFVGALGRMEMEKVPAAGYKIIGLPVAGLQRKLTLKNFSFPFKLMASMRQAKKVIKDFQPDVVVGVGGYASGPVMRAANKRKIPTLIQEQNSYAGITNKLLAKKATKICVAYEGMEKYFPAEKILFTGNPVRQDIAGLEARKNEGILHFGLEEKLKTILVVGGSLGAGTINNAIVDSLVKLVELKSEIQIIWQTGKYYYEKSKAEADKINSSNIHCMAFIKRMDLAYAAADIIISRAGAGTISELCIVGKPVILVPSPNVAEDHQTKNAMALVKKNAAVHVSDSQAVEKLFEDVVKILKNKDLCDKLSDNIKKMEKPGSASIIADEVIKLINKEE
jgi:UDP-N-acetylglucosamine--N-acetylmuramyl-(pentapeptide) pyrophosphoryl-undecaprenol N-acetylglucosamine transferase